MNCFTGQNCLEIFCKLQEAKISLKASEAPVLRERPEVILTKH